ncbi:hypothetical protein GCM10008995_22180 [Halobellus salinus]|uniref:Uncharacterized protein n=1 Tax=Halobellus salinus TaxID=931585 RepID=A0A830EJQ3_9EURY|nr:hypothetical protein [Halobellus salinus]GGJ11840.1 hypothetical protein GCM10008995_22180 [Halobellus salinus]SMP03053.1 hypothetical protein SAMN06265347_101258 [Halobellus salinus]
MREPPDRGQLATSLVEAVVGALLISSAVAGFVWVPVGGEAGPTASTLDRTADDALSILAAEPSAGGGRNRLAAACRSPESFATERDALEHRLGVVLPTSAFGRLETPYGSVGPPQPTGVPVGRATRTVAGCSVTLRVWSV